MARDRFVPRPSSCLATTPFATGEEAWFWFIQAHDARHQGAKVVAGQGEIPRPCEPVDVLRTVDRLYRQRVLLPDHLTVLVQFGRRLSAPNPRARREERAAVLWQEAFRRLTPALCGKGIVR